MPSVWRRPVLAVALAASALGDARSAPPPKQVEVTPLFVRTSWERGWFRASGVWKERGVPVVAGGVQQAIAALDEHSLSARTELYDIASWDTKSIRTAPSQEPCGYFVIVVDRDPPKVYANKVNDQRQNQICTTPGLVETMELDCVAPGSVIGTTVR